MKNPEPRKHLRGESKHKHPIIAADMARVSYELARDLYNEAKKGLGDIQLVNGSISRIEAARSMERKAKLWEDKKDEKS